MSPDRPATEGRPACVPPGDGRERICGLAPPERRVQAENAYKVATIGDDSFWVVLPAELAPSSGVVAVPGVPIRVNAHLTTASPRDAAARYCGDFPRCEPVVVNREAVPAGVLTRWDDASGMIRDLEVTTLDLDVWTLVMLEPDAAVAERVARTLTWSVGEDGYPRMTGSDPEVPVDEDWADVVLWVPGPEGGHHLIQVIPGCELSVKEPDLGGSDAGPDLQLLDVGYEGGPLREPTPIEAGRWCVDGRYAVEITFADPPRLERLHAELRIVPSVGQPGGSHG